MSHFRSRYAVSRCSGCWLCCCRRFSRSHCFSPRWPLRRMQSRSNLQRSIFRASSPSPRIWRSSTMARIQILSCHSTAEVPAGTMVPPSGANPAPWFRNIKSGTPFDAGRQSTDYSLQLSVGIANFTTNHGASSAMATPEQRLNQLRNIEALDELPPRAGGAIH
jgi:hypothetical protein